MTPNPEPSPQSAYTPFPLVSLLGIPREGVKLNPDDVIRIVGSQFGSFSQKTFTVAEAFSMLRGLSWSLPASINKLLEEGVNVRIQSLQGKLKLDLEFYPGEEEFIQFIPDQPSDEEPKSIVLSQFSSALHKIGKFTPSPQGFPVEVLQLGSPAWQKGVLWLTPKFYPDSPEAGEMQSPLDEIRKLMADAS